MSERPTVLVVEDDHAVRELLQMVLTIDDFDVQMARDGLEGLLKLKVHKPAVVLLDIMMPDLGGMRFLDQLAEEDATVPVIVITGKAQAADEARQRLGRPNVFTKPFDTDDVIARIREIIRNPRG